MNLRGFTVRRLFVNNRRKSNDARARSKRTAMAAMILVMLFIAVAPRASADSLTITYYTISGSDPDANHLSFGSFNNEVQNSLGPNGLPVLNTPAYGCTSNCISSVFSLPTDLNSFGEITYWDPALNPNVTQTGTGIVSLPFGVTTNFFPPNGVGSQDGSTSGYQAVVLSANLTVPAATTEFISFSIGADDLAFAYLDSQVVCDLGGVHVLSTGTCITPTQIGPGTHTLELFYADINVSQAALQFGVNTADVVVTPIVPEPSGLGLAIPGALLLFCAVRRSRKNRLPIRRSALNYQNTQTETHPSHRAPSGEVGD
jgi:hypothetical protein